jgi:cytidylate kinase
MSGITIVTGSPGAGKTTLSQHASRALPRGLHLLSDVFYTFPAHPISPILREAHEQNAAVIAAVSRAAAAFACRGYEVFLDGIVGPWFLPVVAAELGPAGIPVGYVVLRVSLEEAVRRVAARSPTGAEAVVRHMHAAFEGMDEYASHVLDTTDLSIEESVAQFTRRRAVGDFALDLARVRAQPE